MNILMIFLPQLIVAEYRIAFLSFKCRTLISIILTPLRMLRHKTSRTQKHLLYFRRKTVFGSVSWRVGSSTWLGRSWWYILRASTAVFASASRKSRRRSTFNQLQIIKSFIKYWPQILIWPHISSLSNKLVMLKNILIYWLRLRQETGWGASTSFRT